MRIIITGSPGTGKSVVARKLARSLHIELIDIKELVRKRGLMDKKHEVDIARLSRNLKFLKNKDDYIVEGHLACETKIPAGHVVVLRCSPNILEKRLRKRGYNEEKIRENVLAEILDYCSQRVKKVYGKDALEVDTTKRTPAQTVKEIELAIVKHKKKIDKVRYSLTDWFGLKESKGSKRRTGK